MGKRFRDIEWSLPVTADGNVATWDAMKIAVLMDIRDELKAVTMRLDQLNGIVGCSNAIAIPKLLRQIARNTARYRCRECPRTFETSRGLDQHVRRSHA